MLGESLVVWCSGPATCPGSIPSAGNLFLYVTIQPPMANSAFYPSGVRKWVPASAGKAKAGMVHSVSGCMRGVQVNCESPWECVPYLSALEVCSRRGAIQIHIYLCLTLPPRGESGLDVESWSGLLTEFNGNFLIQGYMIKFSWWSIHLPYVAMLKNSLEVSGSGSRHRWLPKFNKI